MLGNFIGTDVNGTADLGNQSEGVRINNNASNNTIGGTTTEARNIISGNGLDGVEIATAGATGNKVQGNYIGIDVTRSAALGSGDDGVLVVFASNTTIGGTEAGPGNVISGNGTLMGTTGNGITIFGADATGNLVQGDFIGTDFTGTADLGNRRSRTGLPAGSLVRSLDKARWCSLLLGSKLLTTVMILLG